MPYTIEQLPQRHAIVITFTETFDVSTELAPCFTEVAALLDKSPTSLTLILDILQYPLSFEGLLDGTKIMMGGATNPIRHAKTKRYVAITSSPLINLSVDGFRKLGIGDVHTARSMEEVLKTL
jgi:hypothetical protein